MIAALLVLLVIGALGLGLLLLACVVSDWLNRHVPVSGPLLLFLLLLAALAH